MALFQNTVVAKYLRTENQETISNKWDIFKSHFHNPQIQENIRNSNEEQYQEGFLRDLFVKVFGYILNPESNYNLTTEYKNVKDSKKADGAVIINNKVVAVIELKGTNITDLGRIENQAFGYKNNQPDCTYIITSNFEKIRFYIDNAIDFIEFNLFELSKDEFDLMYLCLAYHNIEKDVPAKIKKESLSQEDAITKKLYKDYSEFKSLLFENLTLLNPQYDQIELFKKSQKLLDRFLFIFFAEDSNLLPPNSIRKIVEQWQQLKDLDAYTPLYDRFIKYFGYLNTGYKGKEHDVFPYNGGLFLPDDILDNVKIDDDILEKHSVILADYDYVSEVDVNILGHIFEHSLNEIEEIKANLEGQTIDKSKSKRKKDGVFYTPKYITKYIVENTVGKLCKEKKEELKIQEELYTNEQRKTQKQKKELLDKLNTYRNWLLEITICDPACGSGAFLNQALNFLIEEHKYIDELQAKLFGDAMVLSDVDMSILENNLYGIDINEESVEIAKLSLWLRTAKPNRKLNILSNNIKCGNSLIDDPEVAGDKAFNWQKEFPQVFKEKNKKAWHITTATHDSRTSQRMIDYKVRERRHGGQKPFAQPIWLKEEDELMITRTVARIVKEDNLNVMAYNICKDHLHLLLVCEEEELDRIVGKIKAVTAREYNIAKGITKPGTRGHASLTASKDNNPATRGHAPFTDKKEKSTYNSLWAQKFGCKDIDTEEQLFNTVDYIKHNRTKHNLKKQSNEFYDLQQQICCDFNHAFRNEYKGGFDVVIGNPPYVQVNDKNYSMYKTQKCADLYAYFFEKSLIILKYHGYFSFITPSLFIKGMRYETLREHLLLNSHIIEILDKGDKVFADVQMPTAITTLKRETKPNQTWDNFLSDDILLQKLYDNSIKLDAISKIMRGLEIGKDKVSKTKSDIQFLTGEDIFRYGINKYSFISNDIFSLYKKDETYFKGKRIIIRETGSRITSIYCNDDVTQQNRSLYSIKINDSEKYNYLFVLALLNSNLIQFLYQTKFAANTDVFPKIRIGQVKELPIKGLPKSAQQPFIAKANFMLSLNKDLQDLSQKFQRSLQREFSLEEFSKKLQNWHELTYADFLKELKKKKISLSLQQKAEWEDYFNAEYLKAQNLKQQINNTDNEIDRMVYELYGLSEEEIRIVELV